MFLLYINDFQGRNKTIVLYFEVAPKNKLKYIRGFHDEIIILTQLPSHKNNRI